MEETMKEKVENEWLEIKSSIFLRKQFIESIKIDEGGRKICFNMNSGDTYVELIDLEENFDERVYEIFHDLD